jgi:hypothetical protein
MKPKKRTDWENLDTDAGVIEFRDKFRKPFDIEAFLAAFIKSERQKWLKQLVHEIAAMSIREVGNSAATVEQILEKLDQIIKNNETGRPRITGRE